MFYFTNLQTADFENPGYDPGLENSGKHFQASGMLAIDSPHKITPIWVILGFLKKFRVEKHEKIAKIPVF